MNSFEQGFLMRLTQTLSRAAAVALLATLAACSGSGPATTVNQQATPPTDTADAYTGPAPANADVQAFQDQPVAEHPCRQPLRWLPPRGWPVAAVRALGRREPCLPGGAAAREPTDPDQSTDGPEGRRRPQLLGRGPVRLRLRRCWRGSRPGSVPARPRPPASSSPAPVDQAAGGGKTFPADPTAFENTVLPAADAVLLGLPYPKLCRPRRQPYFASSNPAEAYAAAQSKINLSQPDQSRFYERLATEFHHCWPTASSAGAPGLPGELRGDARGDHRLRQRHPGDPDRPDAWSCRGHSRSPRARSPRVAAATRRIWSRSTCSRPGRAAPPTTPAA